MIRAVRNRSRSEDCQWSGQQCCFVAVLLESQRPSAFFDAETVFVRTTPYWMPCYSPRIENRGAAVDR